MLYGLALIVHSWLRWLVLVLGVALLADSMRRWTHVPSASSTGAERLRRSFLGALDTQMLLGVGLYALLSPLSRAGLTDLTGAIADPILRFYSIEHVLGMAVGIAVAHAGSAYAARSEPARRYRMLVVTQSIWLLVTLASIPWPGLAYGRPLFRLP